MEVVEPQASCIAKSFWLRVNLNSELFFRVLTGHRSVGNHAVRWKVLPEANFISYLEEHEIESYLFRMARFCYIKAKIHPGEIAEVEIW